MTITNEEKTLRVLFGHGKSLRSLALTLLEAFRVYGWKRDYWNTGANSCYMVKGDRCLFLRGVNDGSGTRIEIRNYSRGPVVKTFKPGDEQKAEIWVRRGCL